MSLIDSILSGGVDKIIGTVGGVIDSLVTTDEERLQLKGKLQRDILKLENELKIAAEQSYQKEIEAKMTVMKAELEQSDTYTKRARPTVIYIGLLAIMINYVFAPIFFYFTGRGIPTFNLPGEFWIAWGGIVSVYAIGRSTEKSGFKSKITKLITGSK